MAWAGRTARNPNPGTQGVFSVTERNCRATFTFTWATLWLKAGSGLGRTALSNLKPIESSGAMGRTQ
jgi:hypothetical protein